MNISFYTFSKKANSTKKPIGIPETIYNCNFLDSTDVVHPSIALVVPAKPTAFNYAYIEDLKRYYFINSWEFVGGRWIAKMTVDALASWKTEIGNLSMYVERSSHDYDLTVIDNMYPTRDFPTIVKQTVTLPWLISVFDARGTYILGVRSSEFGIGSITYYIMSETDMLVLKNILFTDISWASIPAEEISEGLSKVLFDPMQYIVSCVWLPFTVTSTDPTHGAIKFGWWTLTSGTYQEMDSSGSLVTKTHTFDVYKLLNPVREFKTDSNGKPLFKFTIGNHPQVSRGRYLNSAPYTSHKLYFPPFGEYNIDARLVGGLDSIVVDVTVDCTTGEALAHVWGYLFDGKVQHLTVMQTRFGADINISSNGVNKGFVSGLLGGATKLMFGDVRGAFSSIGDAMSQPMQQTESVGNNGSFAWMFENTAYFISNYYTLVDENLSHNGRPLCAERALKNIPGYIKCTESEIEIPCTSTELAMISDDMVGGFFYE